MCCCLALHVPVTYRIVAADTFLPDFHIRNWIKTLRKVVSAMKRIISLLLTLCALGAVGLLENPISLAHANPGASFSPNAGAAGASAGQRLDLTEPQDIADVVKVDRKLTKLAALMSACADGQLARAPACVCRYKGKLEELAVATSELLDKHPEWTDVVARFQLPKSQNEVILDFAGLQKQIDLYDGQPCGTAKNEGRVSDERLGERLFVRGERMSTPVALPKFGGLSLTSSPEEMYFINSSFLFKTVTIVGIEKSPLVSSASNK